MMSGRAGDAPWAGPAGARSRAAESRQAVDRMVPPPSGPATQATRPPTLPAHDTPAATGLQWTGGSDPGASSPDGDRAGRRGLVASDTSGMSVTFGCKEM